MTITIDIYLLTSIFIVCMWGAYSWGKVMGVLKTVDTLTKKGHDVVKLLKGKDGIA